MPTVINKRTTLTSYRPSTPSGRLHVDVTKSQEGSMLSAPLRQTSSGELIDNIPDRGQVPQSARIGGKGKRSFLRPLLLGGRKKKDESINMVMPSAVNHVSRNAKEIDTSDSDMVDSPLALTQTPDGYVGILDDYLHVGQDMESPYEETAFVSDDTKSPGWAPLRGRSKEVLGSEIEPGIDLSSSGATFSIPVTPNPTDSPIAIPTIASSPDSPPPSPLVTPPATFSAPTPITAVVPITPETVETPSNPIIPMTPITQPAIFPTSPSIATPITPVPDSPFITPVKSSFDQEQSMRSSEGKPDHNRVEELRDIDSAHRERVKRERRSERARTSRKIEPEISWLEMVFEDLPFGPDKNLVSPPYCPPPLPHLTILSAVHGNRKADQSLIPSLELSNRSRGITNFI